MHRKRTQSSGRCPNGVLPISTRARSRRRSTPILRVLSAPPRRCRSAMPARSPSSSTAAKAGLRWQKPCANTKRSTTCSAVSRPMPVCFTPPTPPTPSGRNSSATSRRRSPPFPRSSCSSRSNSTGLTMRRSKRRCRNRSLGISVPGSRICGKKSPTSSRTGWSSCSTKRR